MSSSMQRLKKRSTNHFLHLNEFYKYLGDASSWNNHALFRCLYCQINLTIVGKSDKLLKQHIKFHHPEFNDEFEDCVHNHAVLTYMEKCEKQKRRDEKLQSSKPLITNSMGISLSDVLVSLCFENLTWLDFTIFVSTF